MKNIILTSDYLKIRNLIDFLLIFLVRSIQVYTLQVEVLIIC